MSHGMLGIAPENPPIPVPRGSTKTWILTYLVIPLVPFFLGAIIRFITCFTLSWNTFDAGDLVISLTLLSLFINQCILTQNRPLDDEDQREIAFQASQVYNIIAILFTALYCLVKYNDALLRNSVNMTSEMILIINNASIFVKLLSYVGGIMFIVYSIQTQKQHKLRVSF